MVVRAVSTKELLVLKSEIKKKPTKIEGEELVRNIGKPKHVLKSGENSVLSCGSQDQKAPD